MGFLILETGESFPGRFLAGKERAGEVVFNTAHSGYEEAATDPSYFSQILVMTAPHQGNYGESDKVWESKRIWIEGFVCLKMQSSPYSQTWMKKLDINGVPVLSGVDTRQIVLTLRAKGSTYGALIKTDHLEEAKKKALALIESSQKKEKDWPYLICESQVQEIKGGNPSGPRIAVLDFGCKENIIRNLKKRSSKIKIYPPRSRPQEILDWGPEGLLLSNGPGDPAHVKEAAETVKALIGRFFMFGICMGCQILALALGGKTKKLKFGHRGVNHPVKDTLFGKVYVTSQNHGYAVMEGSLPEEVRVTHTNLNDKTVQGFFSKEKKILAVQFHPENHPGPEDAVFLFDEFIRLIKQN